MRKKIFSVLSVIIVCVARVDKFIDGRVFSKDIFLLHKQTNDIKYVLQWTTNNTIPFQFKKRRCAVQNCFITHNRSYFNNLAQFHVILFQGSELTKNGDKWLKKKLPLVRSPYQKYVFVSSEPSDYYRLYSPKLQGFFNWTWTYKLDSDIPYTYISIRNSDGELIGPKREIHWMKLEQMNSINNSVKAKLQHKTKAAAWFVTNCKTLSKREIFVERLKKELKIYDLEVDVYGKCGNKQCPKERKNECFEKIQKEYYFYLAFENSFSEDYVSEKLLNALQHYAVPIVYGAANYTRFMPDGIYLNARELGAEDLARKMNEIIHDKERYFNYFKWHNHYSFHPSTHAPDSDPFCRFCATLNNEEAFIKHTVYVDFTKWWNDPWRHCKEYVPFWLYS